MLARLGKLLVAIEAAGRDAAGDRVGVVVSEPLEQLVLVGDRGDAEGHGGRLLLGEKCLAALEDLGLHALRDRVRDVAVALGEAVLVEVARADAADDAVGLVLGALEALVVGAVAVVAVADGAVEAVGVLGGEEARRVAAAGVGVVGGERADLLEAEQDRRRR